MMIPANTMRAAGGATASRGLRARTASACAAKAAAQTAVMPATSSGGRGWAGATCELEVRATEANASIAACSVRAVGRPYTVVLRNTRSDAARTSPAALTRVASARFRRSNAAASRTAIAATRARRMPVAEP